jgi:hypothetical protein
MKTVNSLSAGKSSSYIAVHYPADYELFSLVCIDDIRSAPKDKAIIKYVNEKLIKYIPEFGEFIATAEDDKSIYAMRDLEQLLGREIIWVRGESFDSLINKRHERVKLGNRKRLPSWARRYCTEEMKLLPIFLWWFHNLGEKCSMRIGFRFDEFDRMERFFNNSNPTIFSIPTSCRTYGQKQQNHEIFNWRTCHFPLVKNSITKSMVDEYWKNNGWIGEDTFFENKRQIEFPEISNCVGCFHKKESTLTVQWQANENKMNWFSEQEEKDMGTWLDSKKKYALFRRIEKIFTEDFIKEVSSCDSAGCTD